jgi:hypothetical protein
MTDRPESEYDNTTDDSSSSGGDTYTTRRAFMKGQWFSDGNDEAPSAEERGSPNQSLFAVAKYATQGALLLVGVLMVSVAFTSASAGMAAISSGETPTATGPANISPDEAVEQREQALDRLAELRELDSDPLVSVDQSTIETVSARIEQGNISYTRANYDNASDHWQIARDQASAALIQHYNLGADRHLNATSDYLNAREEAGYTSAEMSRFRQQAQQIRAENASGLQESRNRYQAAQNLDSTVESELPSMDAVKLANRLTPLPMSAAVVAGVLLALLGIAGYLGFRRGKGQTPEPVVEDDDDDNEEPTDSTLRG